MSRSRPRERRRFEYGNGLERWYVHGDRHARNPDRYYCARCEDFYSAQHFEPGQCPEYWTGRNGAELIARGIGIARGDLVPMVLVLAPGTAEDSFREYRARWCARYYRPVRAATVWDRQRRRG